MRVALPLRNAHTALVLLLFDARQAEGGKGIDRKFRKEFRGDLP